MLDQTSKSGELPDDPLSAVLRGLRLDGVSYKRCQMGRVWGRSFEAGPFARVHFVSGADVWLREPAGDWILLPSGTGVLVPRGDAHALASARNGRLEPFDGDGGIRLCNGIYDLDCGHCEGGPTLFTGTLRFNLDAMHPLLQMMPPVIRTCTMGNLDPSIQPLLDAMTRELALSRVGAAGVMARLADVLAALIIRAFVESGCGDAGGWVAALRNPEVGRVIAAIHLSPEAEWNVASMASLMGASRSSFVERFTRIVGEAPSRYVTRIRMYQAKQWLMQDGARVSLVAARLGYESDAAFSRAFKRVVGAPPARFRSGAES